MSAETTVQQLLDSKENRVYTTTPGATVFDALKTMSDAKVGALPVIEEGKLVGIFTERDYARKIILEGKASKDTLIREIMTTSVTCISPDQTVRECMAMMNKNRFRHLPVVEEGAVVGIISIGDMVRAILMSLL